MAHLERVHGTVTCKIGAPIGFEFVHLVGYFIAGLFGTTFGIALGRLLVG